MRSFPNGGGLMEIKRAYHVAFLVADIGAGIEDFGSALGLTFRPVQTLTTVPDPSGGGEKAVLSSYSYEGPPYVQLIEGQESGVYGLGGGEGFHHFGVWVDDAQECRQVLVGGGLREQTHFGPDDAIVAWYNEPADLHGIRVEYTGEVVRPGVESFLRGEIALGDVSNTAER
jgi:hypothetical protein